MKGAIANGESAETAASFEVVLDADDEKFVLNMNMQNLAPVMRRILYPKIDLLNVYTYIDFPNLVKLEPHQFPKIKHILEALANPKPGEKLPEKPLNSARFNFFAFYGLLSAYNNKIPHVVRENVMYNKSYTKEPNEDFFLYKRMRAAGFEVKFSHRPGKDVDPIIIEAISGLKEKPGDICLNLVSGDSDYFPSVNALKAHVEASGRKFILRIFSWKEKASGIWSDITKEIYYFNDLIRFIDYRASFYFDTISLEPCLKNLNEE